MTATMIQTSAQIFNTAVVLPRRLRDYQQAYANFRRFKSLDADQLSDLGLTSGDVAAARYGDFLGQRLN